MNRIIRKQVEERIKEEIKKTNQLFVAFPRGEKNDDDVRKNIITYELEGMSTPQAGDYQFYTLSGGEVIEDFENRIYIPGVFSRISPFRNQERNEVNYFIIAKPQGIETKGGVIIGEYSDKVEETNNSRPFPIKIGK